MSRVSRAGVLAAYRDGITVICELAAQFTDATWLAATPCAEWRAACGASPTTITSTSTTPRPAGSRG